MCGAVKTINKTHEEKAECDLVRLYEALYINHNQCSIYFWLCIAVHRSVCASKLVEVFVWLTLPLVMHMFSCLHSALTSNSPLT